MKTIGKRLSNGVMALALAVGLLPFMSAVPAAQLLPQVTQPTTPQTNDQQPAQAAPAAIAAAPDGATAEFIKKNADQVNRWEQQLKSLLERVSADATNNDQLRAATLAQRDILTKIQALRNELEPLRDAARAQLEKLKPAEQGGEPPAESTEIRQQRASVGASFAALDGLAKKLDVLAVEAGQIADIANTKLRERFAERILTPVPEIYTTSFWQTAFSSIASQTNLASRQLTLFASRISENTGWRFAVLMLLPILVSITASFMLLNLFRRSTLGQLRDAPGLSVSARGSRAVAGALIVSVPIAIGFTVFYMLAERVSIVPSTANNPIAQILVLLTVTIFFWSLAGRAFIPRNPEFRLFKSVSPEASRAVAFILMLLIATWFVNGALAVMDAALFAPRALSVMREAVVVIIIAALIVALLCVRLRKGERNGWPHVLFNTLLALAGLMIAAMLLGFVSLAEFSGAQLVGTGGVLFAMYLVHNAADYVSSSEAVGLLAQRKAAAGRTAAPVGSGLSRMAASLVLDLIMLVVGIPALLLQWGFDWVEVRGWIATAFFGFQIGNLTISIQSILFAVGIVAAGLITTRLIQRWFRHRSSVSERADSGVRDSIEIVLGYIGILISAALAVSYLGIDFTSLAIVAGALSVGIGFGLQNIVGNFISGLILLAERPIKAGDWIVVGQNEGVVKRVSVRATEITTFDRSSVLIPNSQLIAGEVTNWTLGNTLARVMINVGVAYDSDPAEVMKVLRDVGTNHPLCLEHPAPQLVFEEFADSSMNFSLRIFINDVRSRLQIETELRAAIWTAFKEAGIEIPFPQRDLRIRHLGRDEAGNIEDFLFGNENVA